MRLLVLKVWCLLKRYEAEMSLSLPFSTSSTDLSVGMMQDYFNAVLPTPVFHTLTVEFHVTFECFASPLNCHYPQFCSPFPDTDGFFGSRGSLMQFLLLTAASMKTFLFCSGRFYNFSLSKDHFRFIRHMTTTSFRWPLVMCR